MSPACFSLLTANRAFGAAAGARAGIDAMAAIFKTTTTTTTTRERGASG
jgi:hypothetical protein